LSIFTEQHRRRHLKSRPRRNRVVWQSLKVRRAQWAENCPENFANRAALVAAEIARLEGWELEALRLYEDAIRLAREQGFIQNEGFANELAARFCTALGLDTSDQADLPSARQCYLRYCKM
jgi:hypothetical protein